MSGVVSVGVAVAAIGGAVVSGGATFAVIAAVGATVAAVGAITKVKELQIAGAAIGVVGAVGGIASAAGAFGSGGVFGTGGTIFGAASAPGTAGMAAAPGAIGIDAEIANWSTYGTNAATDAGGWAGAKDFISTVNGAVGDTASTAAAAPAVSTTPDWSNPGVATGSEPVAAGKNAVYTDAIANKPALPIGTEAPQGTVATTTPGTPTTAPATAPAAPVTTSPTAPAAGTTPPASDSVWKDIMSFAKNNQTLVGGAFQAGASFLSGATNPLTDPNAKALKAQADANKAASNKYNAEADILNMQRANMSQPIPVASRTAPNRVGLINQPMVTGVV